ncbi:MAG TPA: metallophosphoesterase [Thermoanaerobaculia bacterium]|nr:metallophosphoesterase [Thermoanaerobaculia bacterium]
MKDSVDRRSFLKIAGTSIGIGALFHVAPMLGASADGRRIAAMLGRKNGEAQTPFSFIQLSDTHVGFSGPPNPLGTQAFERAVEMINGLRERPDLVLVTGDLTHDSEKPGEHADRMKLFQKIAGRLNVPLIKVVPGEHDAGLDGGVLFRDAFGETHYSFDHRGVHFIALDNVSQARPNVGPEQIAWLNNDLSRFPTTAPIVVFTHRPLFDLRPDWEWFTGDGDEVMNALAPYENVTVLYGHIHREHTHTEGRVTHHAARSLIFAFPDPEAGVPKKPIPFDPQKPFENLGLRVVEEPGAAGNSSPRIKEVELTLREYSGTVGIQQLLKEGVSL